MNRVVILYDREPDADAYAGHVEVCQKVPGAVFRHGKVTGSPMGEPVHAYYAEFEFADKDAFKNGVRSDEFMAAGKDVQDRGLPQPTIEFVELG
ncbi:MAG TPA: hypothetical protein VIG35_05875 [Gaiellaceae bacterium]|jgi:hypothetical protein